MSEKIRGNQVLVGSYGEVWIDGDKVFELQKIETKVIINREEVQFGMDVDSNMTGFKGEYTLGIKKVFSRWDYYWENYFSKGIDKRFTLIAKLGDPNARGGALERRSYDNCWFDELPLSNYEMGKPIEEEIKGGFTPSDMQILDKIK
ncbi:MAG: hypothetical protein KGV43_02470 [Arcobacter sp.]|nr:hypothetical protein [Arcobacter sp.]